MVSVCLSGGVSLCLAARPERTVRVSAGGTRGLQLLLGARQMSKHDAGFWESSVSSKWQRPRYSHRQDCPPWEMLFVSLRGSCCARWCVGTAGKFIPRYIFGTSFVAGIGQAHRWQPWCLVGHLPALQGLPDGPQRVTLDRLPWWPRKWRVRSCCALQCRWCSQPMQWVTFPDSSAGNLLQHPHLWRWLWWVEEKGRAAI